MNFWQRLFSRKASEARIAMTVNQIGKAQTPPANYETYAKQGYQKNVIVYRCVNMIADACSGVPWELYKEKGKRRRQIEDHILLTLLDRPNPMQGQSAFMENLVSYLVLDGNSYIEAVGPRPGSQPRELYVVRPDRMKVVPGKLGFPSAYEFSVAGQKKVWAVDFVNGKSQICHLKTFHPSNDWYGMSPLEAAIVNLDQNNSVNTWNNSLLKNMATPSGVLQVTINDANPSGTLTSEQFERLKRQVQEDFMGARNSGRPMLLEGGMKWEQISLSPKDMDFVNNKNVSARDIALSFGVPPMLLGIPGDNTYSNYKEARQAFYEDTVLPILSFITTEFNNWLTPAFGDNLYLYCDESSIDALSPKREAKFTSIQNANWLTINEKREATGYEPKDGWNVLLLGSEILNADEPFEVEDESEDAITETAQPSPAPQNDEEEISDEGGIGADEQAGNDQQDLQFKAVNLITANDKRKSWRQQNRRRKQLEDAFYKDVKEDFEAMIKQFNKVANDSSSFQTLEFGILKEIDSEFAKLEKTLYKHIHRGINEFGDVIFEGLKSAIPHLIEKKKSTNFVDFAKRYAARRAGEAVTQIKGTTQKQVRKYLRDSIPNALEEGLTLNQVADQLTTKFTELSSSRARVIARTETTTATQTGSLEAARDLEVPNLQKEWVSAQDDRVRGLTESANEPDHAVMNGQVIELDGKFTVPPDATMEGPGDPGGGASQVCNCRCVLVYKVGR